jgi:hypothetical protein
MNSKTRNKTPKKNFLKLNKEKAAQARVRNKSQDQTSVNPVPKALTNKSATQIAKPAKKTVEINKNVPNHLNPVIPIENQRDSIEVVRRLSEETNRILAECENLISPKRIPDDKVDMQSKIGTKSVLDDTHPEDIPMPLILEEKKSEAGSTSQRSLVEYPDTLKSHPRSIVDSETPKSQLVADESKDYKGVSYTQGTSAEEINFKESLLEKSKDLNDLHSHTLISAPSHAEPAPDEPQDIINTNAPTDADTYPNKPQEFHPEPEHKPNSIKKLSQDPGDDKNPADDQKLFIDYTEKRQSYSSYSSINKDIDGNRIVHNENLSDESSSDYIQPSRKNSRDESVDKVTQFPSPDKNKRIEVKLRRSARLEKIRVLKQAQETHSNASLKRKKSNSYQKRIKRA